MANADALQAAFYRWVRAAWLEGADTGEDPVVLRAIEAVYTEEEMDSAILAELQKPENAALLAGAAAPSPAEGGDDWRHLKDYGYAPGGYMTRCRTCGDTPTMDKRAWRCRPCAEAAYANGQAQREQEDEAALDAEQGPLLVAARKVIAGSQPMQSCHGGYVVPAELWLALQGEVMEQLREHARRAFNPQPKGTELAPWQLERMRHIANEWADMATNGTQWLRNIRDGISTVEEALASMATNYEHCRKVNDAPGLYGSADIPAPAPGASGHVNRHTGMWEGPETYPEEDEVSQLIKDRAEPQAIRDLVARIVIERDEAREALAAAQAPAVGADDAARFDFLARCGDFSAYTMPSIPHDYELCVESQGETIFKGRDLRECVDAAMASHVPVQDKQP